MGGPSGIGFMNAGWLLRPILSMLAEICDCTLRHGSHVAEIVILMETARSRQHWLNQLFCDP